MIRRITSWVLLVLAGLLIVLATYFVRPADVYEMLVGFTVGTVGTFQWLLLGGATLLLAAVLVVDKPAPRNRRMAVRVLGSALIVLAIVIAIRDNATFSRETISVVADSVRLEGTKYQPRKSGNVQRPAILLLHGSGPVRRGAYHGFARRFVEHGFIVLNMDKRGVGGSSGRYYGDDLSNGVIETRAVEARAALQFLRGQPGVDTARIGVFSMSQGGWIVPLLLGGDSPARFGVVFSGVAVSAGEEGAWSEWTDEDNDHFGFKPPPTPFDELDARIRTVSPASFNPRPALAQMKRPTIWMFGEWDSSAPTAASARVLDTLQRAGIPIAVRVFPEANHGLMVVRGPQGKRNADFADGLWEAVFQWTDQQRITRPAQE